MGRKASAKQNVTAAAPAAGRRPAPLRKRCQRPSSSRGWTCLAATQTARWCRLAPALTRAAAARAVWAAPRRPAARQRAPPAGCTAAAAAWRAARHDGTPGLHAGSGRRIRASQPASQPQLGDGQAPWRVDLPGALSSTSVACAPPPPAPPTPRSLVLRLVSPLRCHML